MDPRISQRHGSTDPDLDPDLDPHQNVMDPEHWFFPTAVADIFLSWICNRMYMTMEYFRHKRELA